MRIIGVSFLQEESEDVGHLPLTPTETLVLEVWQDVLRVSNLDRRSDFFEVGGNSVAAARIMERLSEHLGVSLPIADLYQQPTVAALAARLDGKGPSWSPLIVMQPHGTMPALFCVHGDNGHVVRMMSLARLLGPERPVYGFEARGVDGRRAPLESVEAMAAEYVTHLRRVQPNGPYFLLGHSFGGVVAFEMAQQLRRLGQEVAWVVLLDSIAPRSARGLRAPVASYLGRRFRSELSYAWRAPRAYATLWRGRWRKLGRFVARRGALDALFEIAPSPDPHEAAVKAACLRAFRSYLGVEYDGRVLYLRARQRPLPMYYRWRSIPINRFVLRFVEGDHMSMLDPPHVDSLVEELKKFLRE